MSAARVPAWRIAAGVLVLVALLALGGALAPVYLRNLEFQHFVSQMMEDPKTHDLSDDTIRTRLVEKAQELDLPVHLDNIQIARTPDAVRIAARYVVHVNLAVYAVDLHFYPGTR